MVSTTPFQKVNLFQVGFLGELCCAVDDGERVLNGLLHLSVHLVAGVARAEVGDLVGAAAVVVARRVLRGQRDQGGGWKQAEGCYRPCFSRLTLNLFIFLLMFLTWLLTPPGFKLGSLSPKSVVMPARPLDHHPQHHFPKLALL